MVNTGMANAWEACVFLPAFGEFPRVFARILRFLNPFKYIRNFKINHETVHFSGPGAAGQRKNYPSVLTPCGVIKPSGTGLCYHVRDNEDGAGRAASGRNRVEYG